jgi:hypothetical protein
LAYQKTNWDLSDTPVNPTNLNKIENELETLDGKFPIIFSSINSSSVATQAQAEAGTANNVLMTPLGVKQYVINSLYPHETLVATWSESINANASVAKSMAHTLGVIPSKILVNFRYGDYCSTVEIKVNGTDYNYRMSGYISTIAPDIGYWKREDITGNYLFGAVGSSYYGSMSLGDLRFRLNAITMTSSAISFPITNSSADTAYTLSSSVSVEVYA